MKLEEAKDRVNKLVSKLQSETQREKGKQSKAYLADFARSVKESEKYANNKHLNT